MTSQTRNVDGEQLAYYERKLAFEIDSSDLYNALEEGREDIVVVDGRGRDAYARQHIAGAINLPHSTISTQTVVAFARGPLYVTYCDGIGCNASTRTAAKLLGLGFRVKELLGGLDWWIRDGYATEGDTASIGTASADCGCDGADVRER